MILSGAAISEVAIGAARDVEGLPFGAWATVSVQASGTPSLLRAGAANALVSCFASASMRVIVFASSSAIVTIAASATPNFVLYAATREFISRSSDQVADQPFFGTLEPSIQLDQSIINDDGFGRMTIAWGEITLINIDGEYDEIIGRYAADGRRLLLKIGDETLLATSGYDGFYPIFDGVATRISVEEKVMRVFYRDGTYKLETPAQRTYLGTGGLEGTADLAGKRVPRSYGYADNVTPALVSPTLKLFQVNDGQVQAITAVYSRAAAVTFDQDYASAALLMAATIPGGKYATCLAAGLFRVNFVLEGEVTADVQGDKAGGVFVSTSADIVQRVVSGVTGVTIDAASFAAVNALQPAPIGFYLDTASSAQIADVVADIMGPIGGYGGTRRDSQTFELVLFRAPSGIPSASYSGIEIIDIKREALPSGIDPQPYRYRVAWGRNWTVQTDLATSLTAARVAYLKEEFRLAEVSQLSIKIDHPLAQDPPIVSGLFRDEADARAQGELLLDLYGLSDHSLYRFVIKSKPFVHRIGDLVEVSFKDRWDLVTPRLLRIVSVSERIATNEVELIGFG
jgi:hypothetical protein